MSKEEVGYIKTEEEKGHIVFLGHECQLMATPFKDFMDQPLAGILYDLNLLPEVTLSCIDSPDLVNNYAASVVIRSLHAKNEQLRSDLAAERKRLMRVIEQAAAKLTDSDRREYVRTIQITLEILNRAIRVQPEEDKTDESEA